MAEHNPTSSLFAPLDTFVERHIGPSADEVQAMLKALDLDSLDALVHSVIPKSIQRNEPLSLGAPRGEHELLQELKGIASQNKVFRSMIGMGYSNCITPPVIQRNILENPGWYTQYTPYQAEISQGRMEALINFQTMVADLTGLPLANASMLDEATAAQPRFLAPTPMRSGWSEDAFVPQGWEEEEDGRPRCPALRGNIIFFGVFLGGRGR